MTLSITKAVCEWPTDRHQSVGTGSFDDVQVDPVHGCLLDVGRVGRALDRSRVDAVLDDHRREGRARR